jgi:hypothetical protein
MRRAQGLSDSIHATLSTVAADAGEQTLVAALNSLHDLYDLAGPRDPAAVLALDGVGVHITAAERTVVETHSFASPRTGYRRFLRPRRLTGRGSLPRRRSLRAPGPCDGRVPHG